MMYATRMDMSLLLQIIGIKYIDMLHDIINLPSSQGEHHIINEQVNTKVKHVVGC